MNKFNRRLLRFKLRILPRRALCIFGHKWDEPDFSFIDGPIDLPPRERGWMVLDFHKQCDRCYVIRSLAHTEAEDAAAIEAEILAEEAEAE